LDAVVPFDPDASNGKGPLPPPPYADHDPPDAIHRTTLDPPPVAQSDDDDPSVTLARRLEKTVADGNFSTVVSSNEY
jgi:hypothetical protein